MRGMKLDDLLAIVDFLYYGKADIFQDNLDTFLNIAEEFQLKGLYGTETGGREEDGGNSPKKSYNPTVPSTEEHRNIDTIKTEISSRNNSFTSKTNPEDQTPISAAVSFPKHEFSGDMKELDEKIGSLMCLGGNMIMRGAKKKESAYKVPQSNFLSTVNFNFDYVFFFGIFCHFLEHSDKKRGTIILKFFNAFY